MFLVSLLILPGALSISAELDSAFVSKLDAQVLKHLKVLSSDQFSGRKFASHGSNQAQLYLINTLKTLNVPAFKDKYRHPFIKNGLFQDHQGTNIIAFIPGTKHAQEYIVLSAHYDHLGAKRGKVFNGADDNASGTAALLHYAKVLKQNPLKYSVILLFTDGEEIDLLGAKAFISQQKTLLPHFKLNINLDMIAGSKKNKRLHFISRDIDKLLNEENIEAFNLLQSQLSSSAARLTAGFKNFRGAGSSIKRTNWRMASDHGIFSRAGIPFIYFGVGTHKNYHTVNDDFENVNQALFLASIDTIFEQIVYLDNAMSIDTHNIPADVKSN